MIRRLSAILTLVLLIFIPAGAQKKLDRDREQLLGEVRSVRSQLTDYDDSNPQEEVRTKQRGTAVYDRKGNITESTIYDDYGFLAGKEIRTYDANGNLIGSVLSDDKGALMERRVYSYTNGALVQIVDHDREGAAYLKQVNAYDEQGRLREAVYYDPRNAVGKTVYKYNEKGDLSEAAFYLANGSKGTAPVGPCLGAHRVTYSYDATAKLIKVVAYETDGAVKKSWQYTYDPKGQIAKEVRDSDWSTLTYVYSYEYDSRGNWIKQLAIMTDKSKGVLFPGDETRPRKKVTSREIAYY